MINSNDGGANVSVNAGESWTDQDYPDGAVLQRLHDRARARITCAARSRTTAPRASSSTGDGEPLRRRRRRERLHRAGSARHRRVLCRQLRRPADADQPPDRRAARHQRLARQPDGAFGRRHHRALPVDVSDRHRADRSQHALRHVAARLEVDQRRPELGSGSAPTSRVTIRRRWGRRADRSRSIRPASRPTRSSSRWRRRAVDGKRDLGRIGRRPRARDARRRQELGRRSRRRTCRTSRASA